jgi:death-on-curing protein
VSVVDLDIVDDLAIAAEVTGLDTEIISRVAQLNLADSALHAPAASRENEEFNPGFVDKAAVLIVGLAKNHPLPDGSKRAAWVALRILSS